jgi:hypothetical protein
VVSEPNKGGVGCANFGMDTIHRLLCYARSVDMRSVLRRPRLLVAGALVLGSLALALAEDAFFHTDDGCAVEVHCIACLWHHGAIVVAPAAATVAVAPAPVGAVVLPPTHISVGATPRIALSRGPPLA